MQSHQTHTIKYCIYVLGLIVSYSNVYADFKSDIGYTRLQTELNLLRQPMPDGSGVEVLMAEACGNLSDDDNNPSTPPVCLAWHPNYADNQFQGKTLNNITQLTSGLFSSHATSVARLFFGNSTSIAPGVEMIDTYLADHWLEGGYIQASNLYLLPKISSNRIANHSWIGTAGTSANQQSINSNILRRVDWLINKDEIIHTVGLTNGSANPALLGSAFNVIAVGRSDAGHGQGSSAVDSTYQAGRTRPDLVAPLSTTSSATPVIASAAAILIEIGHNNTSLSTDPLTTSTVNRAGDTINNAERSEVIKAILMAGADRNSIDGNITDYRATTAHQTQNGLDSRFGAGQINIYNSYHILMSGEQNSEEDGQNPGAEIASMGFDYDPSFGGASNNSTASYRFSTGNQAESLSVSLVWNIDIDEGQNGKFNGTAKLHNLDLSLYDVTNNQVLSASSISNNENTENIWATLTPNRDYLLQVSTPTNQIAFDWDYAIAWRIDKDSDHDGIDDNADNCIFVANPNQRDTNNDGYGNRCDADFNNNGIVDPFDFSLLKSNFGSSNMPDMDLNGNGIVDPFDFSMFKTAFGQAPGPSGLYVN